MSLGVCVSVQVASDFSETIEDIIIKFGTVTASYMRMHHMLFTVTLFSQFSSVQDGIYALGKARMCSTPSLGSFPSVAFETVPMLV